MEYWMRRRLAADYTSLELLSFLYSDDPSEESLLSLPNMSIILP
ncbi:hypothetical protein T11_4802 [Trichinella zimbabwensis]|uniref:Uncharacterized protein n=1 Tax=Trichinella zimbabwensis TaxID=268475 RepID=A0A0V1GMD3_9BILA|nr:hypothetical protein T11_4802 [Trichinella zimbabwensis]